MVSLDCQTCAANAKSRFCRDDDDSGNLVESCALKLCVLFISGA